MKIVSFNIAYNNGTLNAAPIVWFEDFKGFNKSIRTKRNIKELFKWAKNNYIPPSKMILYVTLIDGEYYKEFTIKMINVREYKKHWDFYMEKERKIPLSLP